MGLRLWPRRAWARRRKDQRPVARAIFADEPLDAARHERHRVLRSAGESRALCEAAAHGSISGKPQSVAPVLTQKLEIECGGGCAASTATDYLRFALMLMHGGQSGEARILGRKTVEYMLSDQ